MGNRNRELQAKSPIQQPARAGAQGDDGREMDSSRSHPQGEPAAAAWVTVKEWGGSSASALSRTAVITASASASSLTSHSDLTAGVASGATRAALTQHFALANNAADISAKKRTQLFRRAARRHLQQC